jgi:hypothetical protein
LGLHLLQLAHVCVLAAGTLGSRLFVVIVGQSIIANDFWLKVIQRTVLGGVQILRWP